MAASIPGSDSPVQEPFTFPDDWDDLFAQWTGDEFPNLFADLPDGTDLNVGDAPLKVFDDFPDNADLDVVVGPSNLFDDYLNGADVPFAIFPSTSLGDVSVGHDVDVGGEQLDLVDGFPVGLEVDVHDGSEFSAICQDALTYDTGVSSVPAATEPGRLPPTTYTNKDLLQDSHLKATDVTVPQPHQAHSMIFDPGSSLSNRTDGTPLNFFEYGTFNSLHANGCNDDAIPENCESVADSSAAAVCLTVAPFNTILDPSHAEGVNCYLPQSPGRAESTGPTSPFSPTPRICTQDPLVGKPMGLRSTSEKIQSTQKLVPKDGPLVNDRNEQSQPHLGWISYDQSSFTENAIAPRPVHTCDLPENRKRGRREPLSESKRKKSAEMRNLKSCLLCKMKKKDCDDGTPCKRCLYAARNGPSLLPCLRAPLADLTAAFIPPILYIDGKMEHASSTVLDMGLSNKYLVPGQILLGLKKKITFVAAPGPVEESLTSGFSSSLSGAPEIFNIWAESVVENIGSLRGRFLLCKLHILELVWQVYIDQARPSVIKDALKILLLTCLVRCIKEKYHELTYLEYTGIRFQTSIRSLIEGILRDLLPRLQTLLLHRSGADWSVVVSAMTALFMTADAWVPIDYCQHLKGRLCDIENGWNVLLGLYAAAYRGKRLVRANSVNKSGISQSEENALRLVEELNTWVEEEGIYVLT